MNCLVQSSGHVLSHGNNLGYLCSTVCVHLRDTGSAHGDGVSQRFSARSQACSALCNLSYRPLLFSLS